MALLERVATLIRANLNDLIDKAEDPETTIRQVILDIENQLLQVKTQVAIAIADQHALERKQMESEESERQWRQRAEMTVGKQDDAGARAALARALSYQALSGSFRRQVEDQKTQVESLKKALRKLQQKLAEAQSKSDVLIARDRPSRAAGDGSSPVEPGQAAAQSTAELNGGDAEGRFAALEKEREIERLLDELKARRG